MAERILTMLAKISEKYVSRFAVQIGSRIQIVLSDDVEWIGAAGDYVELHVGGRSYLFRKTMDVIGTKARSRRISSHTAFPNRSNS